MTKRIHLLIAGVLLALAPRLAAAPEPEPARAIETATYTAAEPGFMASSHLLLGRDEAILVDAQLTRSDSRELVRLVEASGRTLTTVVVTHWRPEHHLGLAVLARHYPRAHILARPRIVAAIRDGAAEAIARWRPIFDDDLPARAVLPEPCDDRVVTLDGREIHLLDLTGADPVGGSEVVLPTVLHLPAEGVLVASDLVFNGVHPWIVASPDIWRNAVARLRDLGPFQKVLPGHGPAGDGELLGRVESYLERLDNVLAGGATPSQAARAMAESHPEARLPIVLERSLQRWRLTHPAPSSRR